MTSMLDRVIISAALTGSTPMKHQNGALPVTETEIAEAAIAAWNAGAAIVHLHVRDEQGKMVCDPVRFARVQQVDPGIGRGCDRQHEHEWRSRQSR